MVHGARHQFLPVPVSPVISTVLRVADTSSMRRTTSTMARL
jgi:hypothetical protein